MTNVRSTVPDCFTSDHYAYIIGYPDGMVWPQGNITRAEVATIFFRLLSEETRAANLATTNSFTDVSQGMWFNTAISTLEGMGILNGYEDQTFKPDQYITRAETMAVVNRVLQRLPRSKEDLLPGMIT